MPDDEILRESVNRNIQTMTILLTSNAAKTSISLNEFIGTSLASGADATALEALLIDDLKVGGRIFGEFRRSIKSTANGAINNFRDSGSLAEFGLEEKFRWVAVLVNTCVDCLKRHNGPAKEWEKWEAQGLPRVGFTVCKQSCKCVLLPVDELTELLPIKRNAKRGG